MENTRHTLIQRVQNQYDEQAWLTFNATYEGYIYAVLRQMNLQHDDCKDIQQNVLLKLWKQLPKFQYRPGKVMFRSWLYTVIRNTALTHITSRQKEQDRINKVAEERTLQSVENWNQTMDSEWKVYITNLAMQRIKERFSTKSIEIFQLILQGSPAKEIAEKYDLKPNSINKIQNRVKEKLVEEVSNLRNELE